MYILSGFLFPILIFFISNFNFLNYHFNKDSENKYIKNLSIFVVGNLFILSLIYTKYAGIFYNLLIQLFQKNNLITDKNIIPEYYFYLLFSILLIFKKTNILLKRISLIIFLIISTFIWLEANNILNLDLSIFLNNIILNKLTNLTNINNINILNILYLLIIEILYFSWSYLSNKDNLSDWKVKIPSQNVLIKFLFILIFYLLMIFYYINVN